MTETVVVMDQVCTPLFLINRYSPPGATPLGGARWFCLLAIIMGLFMSVRCCEGALTGDAVTVSNGAMVTWTTFDHDWLWWCNGRSGFCCHHNTVTQFMVVAESWPYDQVNCHTLREPSAGV